MSLDLIETRRAFHRIPEPGFKETKTQKLVLDLLNSMPNRERMEVKTWRTGVLVKIKGSHPTKTIGYRTDMDGLPIKEMTGYPFSSEHEGFMHACGHDMHMTIALGTIEKLLLCQPKDDVIVIFQPAEEGPGGALPMLSSDAFQKWKPDFIFALHIAPEYPAGLIATRTGLLFANTSELFIDFNGKGGHAAYPHLANDMVIAASHFVMGLQTIVSRRVNPIDSAVITIGKIEGGTKQNVIAEHARLEGTIRALNPDTMQRVKKEIEAHAKGTETAFQCQIHIDYGANYYQVFNHEKETVTFFDFCKNHGHEFIECREAMTGEDFGFFLKDIPGFMFWLGVNSEAGLHEAALKPDETALAKGVDIVSGFILEGC
ncbi:MAG: N-acetyldiaminopimelate deacetylase [Tuberibacillus sp.]